ncbi:MAG: O-acetylhomoserine sulfhydrylase [Nitrospira bacterium SG8_35_1]|nr:MAG: O-acetylhomoserine sulfhydrylase [Nitrospira bacterium SG8_35_1]
MTGFSTNAIHGIHSRRDIHGALRPPVYDSVAFEHNSAEDINQVFSGRKPAHAYSRITNPTVEEFENRIRLLSGGIAAIAVSSGMAAISNIILTLGGSGTNIVTSRHLFGNSLSLFEKTLKPWGLEARLVSMSYPQEVSSAIDNNTRGVFLETVTNPQLEVADIRAISEITAAKGIPLILDNTVTTPYLFRSKNFGANIEVLSSTKYISGGATSVGGLIIDNGNFNWNQSPRLADWAKQMGPMALLGALRREVYRNIGACLAPHHAYLHSLGLETMSLRIEKSCSNALSVARFLKQHDRVHAVNYPGLEESAYHKIAAKQFSNRFGGILTFTLQSRDECFALINSLKLIRRASNVNDNKTLILHPASTIFCEYTEEDLEKMGIGLNMIRLSVGIEDIDDILNDLERGFASL